MAPRRRRKFEARMAKRARREGKESAARVDIGQNFCEICRREDFAEEIDGFLGGFCGENRGENRRENRGEVLVNFG